MNHDRILILDFGSQVTQLIARRVREAHVYCEVHSCEVTDEFIREFKPTGIILSGSHMSAYEESTDEAPKTVFEMGVPVLGICYGMQTMALRENSAMPKSVSTVTQSFLRTCMTSLMTTVTTISRFG